MKLYIQIFSILCYIEIHLKLYSRILFGVNSVAQDPSAQDSMINDFYLQIKCLELPENTVGTRYVHVSRNCFILNTIRKNSTQKVS